MYLEIIRTTGDNYHLWGGDKFLADCGKGVEGEARAKALWDEVMNLRVASDELRARLDVLKEVSIKCPNCDEETVEAIADPEWIVADPAWIPKEVTGIIVEVQESVTGRYCMVCERLVSVTMKGEDGTR